MFLLLDEALGEFGTQTWLGGIDIQPVAESDTTRALTDLPKFIEDVDNYHDWKKLPPPETYTVYECKEMGDSPRQDTIAGSSIIPRVVCEFIDQSPLPQPPLLGTGAELIYLVLDSEMFPEGQETEVRANIEDALDDALLKHASGRLVGGAFGIRETYVDLLLLDGNHSRQIVKQTMEELQLSDRFRVEKFA